MRPHSSVERLRDRHRRRSRGRRGLGMVELMISLAITAMLLVAIAVAFVSSSQVIENNDRFFRATQAARVALAQMLTEVRRCDAIPITVSPGNPYQISTTMLPIMRPPDGPMQPNEDIRVYEYIPSDGDPNTPFDNQIVLFFRYTNGTESPRYPVASNVQSNPFQWDPGKDSEDLDCVARVSISLEIAVGNQTIRLTGAAAPRRSLTFK
jgi:type II secretory pathway pseudopilin PulG